MEDGLTGRSLKISLIFFCFDFTQVRKFSRTNGFSGNQKYENSEEIFWNFAFFFILNGSSKFMNFRITRSPFRSSKNAFNFLRLTWNLTDFRRKLSGHFVIFNNLKKLPLKTKILKIQNKLRNAKFCWKDTRVCWLRKSFKKNHKYQ